MQFAEIKKLFGTQAKEIIARKIDKWDGKKGCCFLHEDKTASMSWYEEKLTFKCFGCGAAYDIIDYYRDTYPEEMYIEMLHEAVGADFHQKDQLDDMGKEFLKKRGILKSYGKYISSKDGELKFNFFKNGMLENYKRRNLFPTNKRNKFFGGIKGRSYNLFLRDYQINYNKVLYVTEGEIDALTLREIGINSVSYGGASSINLIKSNIEWFKKFPKVVFVCDGDEAGKKQFNRINKIDLSNGNILLIPNNLDDVNNIYIKYGKDFLLQELEKYQKIEGEKKTTSRKTLKEQGQKNNKMFLTEVFTEFFKSCNNLYSYKDGKYLVTNTVNSFFVSSDATEIASCLGLDFIYYYVNYNGTTSILKSVLKSLRYTLPICSGETFDFVRKYGEMVKDEEGNYKINISNNKGLFKNYNKENIIPEKEFPNIYKHFDHIYGDYKDYAFKLLAWNIQNPGVASRVAIVHQSDEQGAGKGLMGALWNKIFDNFVIISQQNLESDFNFYLKNKVVIAEEIQLDNKLLADKLKAYISEKYNSLNIKFKPTMLIRNYSQWIINTNRNIPVFLETTDRRYFVTSQTKMTDQELIKNLVKIYHSEDEVSSELIALIKYCKNIVVSDEDIRDIPLTQKKQDIIDNSKSILEEEMEELAKDVIGETEFILKTKRYNDELLLEIKKEAKETLAEFGEIRVSVKNFAYLVRQKTGKKLKSKTISRYILKSPNVIKKDAKINGKTMRCYIFDKIETGSKNNDVTIIDCPF